MTAYGIITDSSVQFPTPGTRFDQRIKIMPFKAVMPDGTFSDLSPNFLSNFPLIADEHHHPRLLDISIADLFETFQRQLENYEHIIGIFSSSGLTNTYQNALRAAEICQERNRISIIDTISISTGLGNLCSIAIRTIDENHGLIKLQEQVRHAVDNSYFMICVPSTSYLFYSGVVDLTQSIAGQFLSLCPVLSLEDGSFRLIHKIRNIHNAPEVFLEFLSEFDALKSVAIISDKWEQKLAFGLIEQYCDENFPDSIVCKLPLPLLLASLFGPNCIAISIVEK